MRKIILITAVVAVGATMMLDAEQVPVQPRDTVVYTDSTRTDSIALKVSPVINTPMRNIRGN